MMVLFHFLWDLNYFNLINIQLYEGFWGLFQKATALLFLLLVGALIAINKSNGKLETLHDFLKRGIFIFSWGLLLTIISYVLYPKGFIYFGILHLIGVSIILSTPFAGKKTESLIAGFFVILLPLVYKSSFPLVFAAPMPTLDFFPVFPWFGAVLIGIAMGNHFYAQGKRSFELNDFAGKFSNLIQVAGKNSLLIYFTHQLILFPLVFILSYLIA